MACFFSLCCLSLNAQTFFVSTTGDDNASGSRENPLATITEARDRIRELRKQQLLTDTIHVKVFPGTYLLTEAITFTSEDSGTEQSPTVYTSATGERPLFLGGIETGSFEVESPTLWKVFIPETRLGFSFEQVYINGERRFRAQTPNRGSFFQVGKMEKVFQIGSGERTNFSVHKFAPEAKDASFLTDFEPGEEERAVVTFYHKWETVTKPIEYIDHTDTTFFVSGKNMYHASGNSKYFVSNYRKALDEPGEWFLDQEGWLYYIPKEGETPENARCTLPVTEQFLVLKGTEQDPICHLRFQNLRFEVAGYRTPVNGYESPQAACNIEATVMLDHVENIEFSHCDIAHTGTHAIWFRENCSFSRVEHCHLHDLGGGGVKIGTMHIPRGKPVTHHIVLHNNIIQHGGYVFPSAVGVIIFNGSDNEITHNDIANFRYTGISCGWVWGYSYSPTVRNKIEYNHIHYLGWGELSDMGGVYTLGNSEGTTVSNNVIHHIYSRDYGGWGLYTDEGTQNILMENNLVYACKSAGFHQHYGKNNIIRNNIFAFIKISAIQVSRVEEHLSYTFTNNIIYQEDGEIISDVWEGDNGTKIIVDYDRNCYWKVGEPSPKFYGLSFKEWKQSGKDKHSIVADPQFVDPSKYDFRFRNSSSARKIGFKPFDYTKAGVYGSESWVEKSRIPEELMESFEEVAL
ncbi:MAG TPA: right-handed parallel beta-helix repeat-containing protein [Bacteroidales bacterium]|jgi:hypothetical protein|nr:right-handed parallel beta-helix repeat-containing protein [Bacteroidales bacterium]